MTNEKWKCPEFSYIMLAFIQMSTVNANMQSPDLGIKFFVLIFKEEEVRSVVQLTAILKPVFP